MHTHDLKTPIGLKAAAVIGHHEDHAKLFEPKSFAFLRRIKMMMPGTSS